MYWTSKGNEMTGIYTAHMDGNYDRCIVSKDIVNPTGLAIDYASDRLYWLDSKLDRIESCGLDGKMRKVHKIY